MRDQIRWWYRSRPGASGSRAAADTGHAAETGRGVESGNRSRRETETSGQPRGSPNPTLRYFRERERESAYL